MTTATPDEPGVRVTLAQIYSLLLDVQRAVAEQATSLRHLTEDGADHEQRLRALEGGRWPLRQIAALGVVATVALTVVGIVITLAVKTL